MLLIFSLYLFTFCFNRPLCLSRLGQKRLFPLPAGQLPKFLLTKNSPRFNYFINSIKKETETTHFVILSR